MAPPLTLFRRVSALEPKRLFVMVAGDEIIVTSSTGFRAVYCKRPNLARLKVRRRTQKV
jgi:hypothetical protein